jgi:hypothetical protein
MDGPVGIAEVDVAVVEVEAPEVEVVGMTDEVKEEDVLAAVEETDDVLDAIKELDKLDEPEVVAITELGELEALELIEELEELELEELELEELELEELEMTEELELEATLELREIDRVVEDDETTVELLTVDELALPSAYSWILFPAPQYENWSPGQRKLQSAWFGTSLLSGIRLLPQ